ncbi:MAG: hypothetical protein JNL92_09360 [Opitutaceae bacterium]|nr:hypothetical protein [Opitutaceae bacterium]
MRLIPFALAVGLALLALTPSLRAADNATVRAILITATNLKREADPRLAPYEAELQRNLPLSSFRYVGEGSTAVTAGAKSVIALERGNRIELEGERSGGRGIRMKVLWQSGRTVIMNTTLTLQPGVPAVLGRRPSGDGETPIVLLIAR